MFTNFQNGCQLSALFCETEWFVQDISIRLVSSGARWVGQLPIPPPKLKVPPHPPVLNIRTSSFITM